MAVKLQTAVLQSLITKALSSYIEENYPTREVVIEEDYFWNIEQKSLYDVASEPKELTMGSLHDVVMELERLANQDSTYISDNIDIRRISFLLRYLSGI